MKNYFDLKGQVAIVTGCSTGLGVQMAKALANQGCNIVCLARRKANVEANAKMLEETYGVKAIGVVCDVTDTESVEAAVDQIVAEMGRIDILLIPVGGHYTIGPETAAEVVRALRPGITVPMHYRGAGFGYDVIGPVEDFTRLCGPVRRLDGNVLCPEGLETPATVLLRCPVE